MTPSSVFPRTSERMAPPQSPCRGGHAGPLAVGAHFCPHFPVSCLSPWSHGFHPNNNHQKSLPARYQCRGSVPLLFPSGVRHMTVQGMHCVQCSHSSCAGAPGPFTKDHALNGLMASLSFLCAPATYCYLGPPFPLCCVLPCLLRCPQRPEADT